MGPTNRKCKYTVYLLHSHPLVREWLSRLINLQADLSVCGETQFSTGALAELAGLRPDVTVVGSLFHRQTVAGLIRELERVVPSTKVVVMSGWADDEEVLKVMSGVAGGYARRSTEIIAAIRRLLEFDGGASTKR